MLAQESGKRKGRPLVILIGLALIFFAAGCSSYPPPDPTPTISPPTPPPPPPIPTPTPARGARTAAVADYNGDLHPDWVVRNPRTCQTAIWYLNNNVFVSSAYVPPPLPPRWGLRGVADFNGDTHPDYALFNSDTRLTAIWYLSGPTYSSGPKFIDSAYGPTPHPGWELVAIADFNANGKPDYVLYNAGTCQTAIWYLKKYLKNYVLDVGEYGPTLPPGWTLRGVADFNHDTHPDYALFNSATRQTAIWYLLGPTFNHSLWGPTLPKGWELVAAKDFNGNGKPDYVLYNAGTHQTAIWYLNNNLFVTGAYGHMIGSGWSLTTP